MPRQRKKAPASAESSDSEAGSDARSVSSLNPLDISKDVFVFTGFRDSSLESAIKAAGGQVANGMNSLVTVVITKDGIQDTNKMKAARERGLDVVSKEEFEANTGFLGREMPDMMPVLLYQQKLNAKHKEALSGVKRPRSSAASTGELEDDADEHEPSERPASPSDALIPIQGEIFVFTGFRDSGLQGKIKRAGGFVLPHMTKAVTVVITKDGMQNTNKARAAVDKGLRLASREEFEAMHGFA
jgi:hypothetical protein